MNYRQPARTRPAVLLALVVGAALLLGVLAYQPLASLGTSSVASIGVPPGAHHDPPGVSVFADDIPSVANLDPDLLRALRRAATDAADDGVEFVVNSGWRSREYQAQLLRDAVAEYGSETEAARWVATPDTSAHVSGDAVDLGPDAATAWLSRHGASYGLCQIYANEPWHYELRSDATDYGCPTPYADPTEDPRMHQ
ncbi:M15 family metallopeptidase [Nocardia puris]|uniref:M15 family metallopeptidase n=1 Tax=Nocardia puris TaxID=208602 RepID=UPI001892FC74|nr:M15 family metallopeptidase [Nocardia puris]MBF6211662.1 M15 family metallopeptidase [Nocardia puris]MBF6365665.1 M15 family metallopeptidase [Nocardia puris]MBF6460692.1 M15 family metallopeptidase [Nocardia puris]